MLSGASHSVDAISLTMYDDVLHQAQPQPSIYVHFLSLKCNFRKYSILYSPPWSISRIIKCICHSSILKNRGTQETSLGGTDFGGHSYSEGSKEKPMWWNCPQHPPWIQRVKGVEGNGYSVKNSFSDLFPLLLGLFHRNHLGYPKSFLLACTQMVLVHIKFYDREIVQSEQKP